MTDRFGLTLGDDQGTTSPTTPGDYADDSQLEDLVERLVVRLREREASPFQSPSASKAPWSSLNPLINKSKLLKEAIATELIWGDGNDGDVTISGNTTLTRDMTYDNLAINSGIVLSPAGFRIYVKNKLTNNGTIRYNGSVGGTGVSGGAGGAGAPAGNIGGGSAGGAGGIEGSSGGSNGVALTNGLGSVGGTGGQGEGKSGGTGQPGGVGGTSTLTVANRHGLVLLSTSSEVRGGRGGGGGGNGQNGADPNDPALNGRGGGGGGGGGIIVIAARIIANNGTIEANGGAGGDGEGTIDATGGGGGGGGGGAVVLVYRTINQGSIIAAGGAGGAAGAAGSFAGSAGTAGTTILMPQP